MGMKMDRWKRYGKQLLLFFIISVLVEVFLFNSRAFFSLHATNQRLDFTQEEYTLTADTMSGELGVLYVDLHSWDEMGEAVPLEVIISAWDEGNALGYQMGSAVIYPGVEKTKYLKLHSYGAVRKLEIVIKTTGNNVEVTDLIYDARVPFFISPLRIFLLFGVMTLLWALRPASALYRHEWEKREKCVAVGLLLVLHVFGLLFLIRSNPVFLQPDWAYHKQYSRLAEALCQGRLSIDAGSEDRASPESIPYGIPVIIRADFMCILELCRCLYFTCPIIFCFTARFLPGLLFSCRQQVLSAAFSICLDRFAENGFRRFPICCI